MSSLVETTSETFPFTDEGHEHYKSWRQLYHNEVFAKYGFNAKNIHETRSEMFLDGERYMIVVLQLELVVSDG